MSSSERTQLRHVLATNLRKLMEDRGIRTLEELSRAALVSQSMLSNILKERVDPRTLTLGKLASALGTTESVLLERSGNLTKPSAEEVEFATMHMKWKLLDDEGKSVVRWILFGQLS